MEAGRDVGIYRVLPVSRDNEVATWVSRGGRYRHGGTDGRAIEMPCLCVSCIT